MRTRFALLPLALLAPLAFGLGCTEHTGEPEEGILFVVLPEEDVELSHDAYEIQLRSEEPYHYYVVTVEESLEYQIGWSQEMVDEREGQVLDMTAYESLAPSGPDYDNPLSETRELRIEGGMTNEGRVVVVYVSE